MKGFLFSVLALLVVGLGAFHFSPSLPVFFPDKMRHFLLVHKAESGKADAMVNLARLYESGIDGKPDILKAITWYKQALHLGHRETSYRLGLLALRGDPPIKKNLIFARQRMEEAARLGFVPAYMALGYIHENGLGTEKSDNRAYLHYHLAGLLGAEQAAQSQSRVGKYLSGNEKNLLEEEANKKHAELVLRGRDVASQALVKFNLLAGEQAIGNLQKLVTDAGTVD